MTGLRGRMILAVVATSIATLTASMLVFSPLLEQRLERDRIHELRNLARSIRPALRETADNPGRLNTVAARLQRRAGGRIVILAPDGRTLADTAPAVTGPDPALDDFRDERAAVLANRDHLISGTRGPTAFAASAVGAGPDRLTLVIAKRLDDTRAAAAVVRAALPISLAVGLAVAAGLAVLLSHNLLRRLRRLAADATALGTTGLKHPVAVQGNDEVATVAKAMESMRARLSADEAARVAFLATASHELRTPLASLQATLELLREETLSGESTGATTVHHTDTALRQTHRLVDLASELLELSRLDGHVAMAAEPVDLVEVAQVTAHELGGRLAPDGRHIAVTGVRAIAAADPVAVMRIITILLDNANNYGAGAIGVNVDRDGHEVMVAVRDEGEGLDVADRERVFARFERGHAAGSASGAGLGLPIARGLAEAMGGRLLVRDGARLNCFELWLPAARPDPRESPTTS
jgi:signal transduction histidine kinase